MKRSVHARGTGPRISPSRRRSAGAPLGLERLEERCLLDSGLTQFGSSAALTQYLISTALDQYKGLFGNAFPTYQFIPYGGGGPIVAANFTTAQAGGGLSSGPPTFSQTNVQVPGVDEGDMVKTDGTYIYDLSGQNLVIVKAVPSDSMAVVSRTPIEGTPDVLYLSGSRVTVISTIFNGLRLPVDSGPATFPLLFNSNSKIKVTVFDVTDPSNPAVVQSVTMDGNYLNSRSIGNQITIVDQNYFAGLPAPAYTSFNGEIIYETKDQYLARVSGHEADLALPHVYTGSAASGGLQVAGFLTDPAQLYKPTANNNNDLVSLFSLDVTSNTTSSINAVSLFAYSTSVVYASQNHLYVVSPNWPSQAGQSDQGSNIFQFTLNGPQISLTATGTVPGQALNQFWIDEQGAYLRIATTANWDAGAVSSLYILTNNGGTLQIVGKVENLAPGEAIKSVLFVGHTAYVDTARSIDPLFVLDLTTVTASVVLGSLTLPGNIEYLQALDATHLLGVGRLGAFPNLLQLRLFDVTNAAAPTVVDQATITPAYSSWFWSGSEAEFTHHAVGYFPDFQTLAIPVYGTSFIDANGAHYQSDLWVFKVDVTKGFTLLGQVHHDSQVRRSLVIGNQLYSVADASIQVHPVANPGGPGNEVITSDSQPFLTGLYQDLLNRAPDAGGMAAWTTLINQGATRAQIAAGFEGSLEYRTDQVENLYTTLLGRPADATGLHDFVSRLGAGATLSQVKAAILGSDEYFKHAGGTDGAFLTSLYHDVLGRSVDPTGAAAWGSELASKVARGSVAAAVLSSPEAQQDQIQGAYQTALHRSADSAGLTYFSGIMQHGADSEAVLAAVCGSDEYFAMAH
jgi:inhibitor of cysteine peptidase